MKPIPDFEDVPEYEDDELEAVIAALVKRKEEVEVDSAEHRFLLRQLNGLRYTREAAGPIWESLDLCWDATPLEDIEDPEGQVLPLVRK